MNWLKSICCAICHSGYEPTLEIPSPRDLILQSDMHYDNVQETLTINNLKPNIWLAEIADTNSMDPVLDYQHTCILTDNFKCEDLVVGDVVVYQINNQAIIHRIIKIDMDDGKRRYTLKGDNNSIADGYIVRDEHLKWLLLGVIY